MPDLTSLKRSGDSSQRVDIVFLAEGYSAAEREQFLADAKLFLEAMFSASNARLNSPFSLYQNYFNAQALFVASAQSGMDRPSRGLYVDTAFDASQYGGDGRCLYGDEDKAMHYVNTNVAENARDIVIVLVNTKLYGGAGGKVAWVSAQNYAASEIVLHEIGHSYAGLQDEYADSAMVKNFPLNDALFRKSVHVTDDLSQIPWSAWLGYQDGELGSIATYEGGYYRDKGVWRATQTSKMKELDQPFNAPEKEAFALHYYADIGDYLNLQTAIPGLFYAQTPDARLLSFQWTSANSITLQKTGAYLDAFALQVNNLSVTVTTLDKTGLIRTSLEQTQESESAYLHYGVIKIAQTDYRIESGSVVYQFNGADNQIQIAQAQLKTAVYIDAGLGQDQVQIAANLRDFSHGTLQKISSGSLVFSQENQALWAFRSVEKIQFQDYSINTQIYDNAKTISSDQLSELIDLYLVYYNRIPDADGLNYWINQLKQGQSLQQVAEAFASTGTMNVNSLSNIDFVQMLYTNVMGRKEGADAEGLSYWLNQLEQPNMSKISVVEAILNSVYQMKDDVIWGWGADLLNNKHQVAYQFAVEWGLSFTNSTTALSQLSAITNSITAKDTSIAIQLIGITDMHIAFDFL
jgi:hypothetical protein